MLHDFQVSDVALIVIIIVVVACFLAIQFAPRTTTEL